MASKKIKKRPPGLAPIEMVSPVDDNNTIEVYPVNDRDRQVLEKYKTLKSLILGFGNLKEDHFDKIKSIANGLDDGRSVFLVKHRETGMILVQKIIHRDPSPDVAKMIQSEIDIMHRCVYPNIIQFYGSFLCGSGTDVNIVMEYMNGGCLDAVIRRIGRIDEIELGVITHETLRGLKYLVSEMRVLHRDVKPSNILVNTKGEVKLCDFGVSRTISGTKAKLNTFVGTVRYMAPERLKGEEYSAASDIWALGFSLIELATGQYPLPIGGKVMPMASKRNPRDPNWEGARTEVFKGVPVLELVELICEGDVCLPDPAGNGFSEEFDDFVKSCTKNNPQERCTIKTALEHEWILNCLREKPDLASYFANSLSLSDLEDSLLYSQNRHVKEECGIPVSAGMDNSPIFDLDSMAKKPWEQNKSDEGNFEQNHISKEMFEGNSSEESDIEEEEEVDFNLERVQQSGT
eukprot:m.136771 g.136771  ORF g.136771 m.136771 type:complete len:461 (-) comp14736_c1_seq5:144-1526(-)